VVSAVRKDGTDESEAVAIAIVKSSVTTLNFLSLAVHGENPENDPFGVDIRTRIYYFLL
jgi:hypothetical protein